MALLALESTKPNRALLEPAGGVTVEIPLDVLTGVKYDREAEKVPLVSDTKGKIDETPEESSILTNLKQLQLTSALSIMF